MHVSSIGTNKSRQRDYSILGRPLYLSTLKSQRKNWYYFSFTLVNFESKFQLTVGFGWLEYIGSLFPSSASPSSPKYMSYQTTYDFLISTYLTMVCPSFYVSSPAGFVWRSGLLVDLGFFHSMWVLEILIVLLDHVEPYNSVGTILPSFLVVSVLIFFSSSIAFFLFLLVVMKAM